MDENERTLAIFAETDIEGFNLEEAVARFGGNPQLYLKIIKAFIDDIGGHLDRLAGLSRDGLGDYGIEVHGIKGSCYTIGAKKEGDMALALEMAAREGDFEQAESGNAPFIEAMNVLKGKLSGLLDEVENAGGRQGHYGQAGKAEALPAGAGSEPLGGLEKIEPDRAALEEMLEATRNLNINWMEDVLRELEKYNYEKGGDLVRWIGEQVTLFNYEEIEERLAGIF